MVRENEEIYIPEEKVTDLEKVLRLHQELDVNLEMIDVILNLRGRVESLQTELNLAKRLLGNLTKEI